MNPLVYVIFFLAVLVVVAILVINLAALLTTRRVNKHYNQAIQTWKTQGIEVMYGPILANFLNTRHAIGADGNGALVLTRDALRFAQITRTEDIVIPLNRITDVLLTTSFNGRRSPLPYLVIRDASGQLTGFQIDRPERWAQRIKEFLKHTTGSLSSTATMAYHDDAHNTAAKTALLQP